MAAEAEKAPEGLIGLKRERERIIEIVDRYLKDGKKGHVALIGDPYTGRTALAKEIHRVYAEKATYISFYSIVRNTSFLKEISEAHQVVILDNCHFLFTRKVGGFDILNEFLHHILTSPRLFITTWNTYAWMYLDTVLSARSFFTEIVQIPPMESRDLKQLILARYDQEIRFIQDKEAERAMFISPVRRTIRLPFLKEPVTVPWFRINYSIIRSRFSGARLSRMEQRVAVEDLVFEKINRLAAGNPGVALHIWNKTLEMPLFHFSRIPEEPCMVISDIRESYLLLTILAMETITRNDIDEITGQEMDVETLLHHLMAQGLITEQAGYYSIHPEALRCVIEHLKMMRLVW